MAEIFGSMFTTSELIGADKALTAGDIIRLGEYKVQAGEMISTGYGQLAGQDNATGRVYMIFKDTVGATINGKVRLIAYSAQNRPKEIIREFRTEQLSTNAADRTKQIPFPEHALWLREDERLVLELIPDAIGNGTLDKETSVINLDMTVQAL